MARPLPPRSTNDMATIAQTLHGYDQGHRLLARGGDIDAEELAILDRLSDLSGYVPLGTEFDRYHTGFPCGRYYAFACTWPDPFAVRAGTVLTHTLLIPGATLGQVSDLWSLGRWHRRPARAAERDPYTAPIPTDLEEVTGEAPPSMDRERALDAVVLWFGQPDRPVLWVEEARPDDVIRLLFRLLWPEARLCFAFCTFGLQVRQLQGRPFDFLALPPSARGSFHERARSAAWWQEGQLSNAALREARGQPWVQRVVEQGAEVSGKMRQFCADQRLPIPPPWRLPLYLRFNELEAPARARLTAARARADLFGLLWPDLDAAHACTRSVLLDLLARQGEAALAPRPLWELQDFLLRPSARGLGAADAAFAAEVKAVLAAELPRRLFAPDADASSDLIKLLAASAIEGFRTSILDAVTTRLRSLPEGEQEDTKVASFLVCAASAREHPLSEAIVAPLSEKRRAQIFARAAAQADAPTQPLLFETVRDAARRLADPALAFQVGLAQARPLEGLREATRIELSLSAPRLDHLERLVGQVSPSDRLTWALEAHPPALAAWAASQGAAAAREQQLSLPALRDRCRPAPNGMRVLFSWVTALRLHELREALRSLGETSLPLLRLSLHEPGGAALSLISMATEVLRAEALLEQPLAVELASAAVWEGTQRLASQLAPRLVHAIASSALPGEHAAVWLRIHLVQEGLARGSRYALFERTGTHPASPKCLPRLVGAIGEAARTTPPLATFWIPPVLRPPLEQAERTSLEPAIEALIGILDLPWAPDDRLRLAVPTLHAVRRTDCRAGYPLVERTFPVVYRHLLDRKLDGASWQLLRFIGDDWDEAKAWRSWLIDRWIEWGWPPAAFLRCLAGDEALFQRLARRAAESREGRAFLRRLPEALATAPDLAEIWRGPITRALG